MRISPKTLKKIKLPENSGDAIAVPVPFVPNTGGQQKFFNLVPLDKERSPSDIRWIYLRGGLGSGKSTAGAAFLTSRSLIDPDSRGLITANTYGQLETSTCVALAEFCQKFGHKLEPAAATPDLTARKIAANRYCIINGDYYCLVLSAEVFTGKTAKSKEAGRGLQIRSVWFDEGSYAEESAFNTINTRLGRGDGFLQATGVITSSINKNNPYNWSYSLFDNPDRSEDLKRIHKTIPLSTSENLKYLGEDYERSLRAALTPELIKIELLGEYAVTTENTVFAYFNRDRHMVNLGLDLRYPIHVSLDFNHNPSTAIAAQYYPDTGELIVIREWFLEHSDTFKLSDAIASWFKNVRGDRLRGEIHNWVQHNAYTLHVHGDASGNQKTANSKQTNWQIVKTTLKKYDIDFRTHYKKSNPGVKDTVNSVNCALNADKLFINNSCKELRKDLESLKWDEKGNIDKKTDLMRSHVGDCLRYITEDIIPYQKLVRDRNLSQVSVKPTGVIF